MKNLLQVEGKYLVIQQFGFPRIYRAESNIRANRWFVYLRATELNAGYTDFDRYLALTGERYPRNLGKKRRGRLVLLALRNSVRRPAFIDLLLGKPRIYVEDRYSEAIDLADGMQLDLLELGIKTLVRATDWMSLRAQVATMAFVMSVVDTFFPLYGLRRLVGR